MEKVKNKLFRNYSTIKQVKIKNRPISVPSVKEENSLPTVEIEEESNHNDLDHDLNNNN
jgi:hypothetical protein